MTTIWIDAHLSPAIAFPDSRFSSFRQARLELRVPLDAFFWRTALSLE